MLDKDTRTIAARIEVANADGRLKPEMSATATIEVAEDKREVITLPDAAIVLLEGQPTVFVFEQVAYEARPHCQRQVDGWLASIRRSDSAT